MTQGMPHMCSNAPAGSKTSSSLDVLWLPSTQTSAEAAWTVAHHFSRTCEQSMYWCMTRFAALRCCCRFKSGRAVFWFLLCAHPSCLMHAAQMRCMTMVIEAWPTITNATFQTAASSQTRKCIHVLAVSIKVTTAQVSKSCHTLQCAC